MRDLDQKPPRVTIVNLRSGTEFTAQFNPQRLEESLGVNWNRLGVQGQGHQPLHFVHTENVNLQMDFEFRAYSEQEMIALKRARRLIHSWHYPRDISTDSIGGGSPNLLIVWPGMLSMEVVSQGVRIRHESFNRKGHSTRFTASLNLEEIRDSRLTFDQVEEDNELRFGSATGVGGFE